MPKKKAKTEPAASTEQDVNELVGSMEPWEGWETKLIWWSLIIGFVVLVIGGFVVQIWI
ncbi:MAG: hypothetical protein KGY61_06085 [Desulfobacterales bacterium]|nr:hypothetical protein [Desulfobacterales bacterium]